ncbi:MAG: hypothetical protein EP347_11800 [Alphaproteobacteria bacterium]|nr:MAG: hypothetical protein EP347_11800 [Alphaproteobacteria bacterium]
MNGFQHNISRKIVRHGVLVIGLSLLAGFGLGWALLPETAPFVVGGSTRGWVAAHVGGMLNGVMALVMALVLDRLDLSARLRVMSGAALIFTIWANTIFYWAGNFAPNRGLSAGGNAFGGGTLLGFVAFLPAMLGAVVIFIVLYALWAGTREKL